MVRSKSNVKYYAKQIKHIIMRKDIVYLGMIRCSDIMILNTSDEGYNNGKKYGQKGAICGPNNGPAPGSLNRRLLDALSGLAGCPAESFCRHLSPCGSLSDSQRADALCISTSRPRGATSAHAKNNNNR
jgi:hypothetical protein